MNCEENQVLKWQEIMFMFAHMNHPLILVGIGGMIGSVARYLVSDFFSKTYAASFPLGTFAVNVVGCLLIGLIDGIAVKHNWLSPEWRLFLSTGFCGGFTTFSAFAFENLSLLQRYDYLTFALYSIGSFTVGLLAAYAGFMVTKVG